MAVLSDDIVPLIGDHEVPIQEIAYINGELARSNPERRERIATAVLAALIQFNGKYTSNMAKTAVHAADELAAALDVK